MNKAKRNWARKRYNVILKTHLTWVLTLVLPLIRLKILLYQFSKVYLMQRQQEGEDEREKDTKRHFRIEKT